MVVLFSKNFNSYQLNYLVVEKEALALIWGLQNFDMYVYMLVVEVYTDHNPLAILGQKSKS